MQSFHLPSAVISSLSECISSVNIGFKDSYNFSFSSPSNFRTRCSGGQECLRLKIKIQEEEKFLIGLLHAFKIHKSVLYELLGRVQGSFNWLLFVCILLDRIKCVVT